MSDASDALHEFHAAFDVPKGKLKDICRRRITLHQEEQEELEDALDDLSRSLKPNREELLEAVARELADVVYVAFGTAELLGLDLDAGFAEVHAANMRKLPPCGSCKGTGVLGVTADGHEPEIVTCGDCDGTGRGKPVLRTDGKVLKPAGWTPPSMKVAIRQ